MNRSEGAKRRWTDPRQKAAQSAKAKARWADPQYRERMIAIRAAARAKKLWAIAVNEAHAAGRLEGKLCDLLADANCLDRAKGTKL